jgi:hypothetical protein
MRKPIITMLAAIAVSSCTVGPYVRCHVARDDWKYIPSHQLGGIDIEARRTVTEAAMSEFLYGNTEQLWFKHSDSELLVCRTFRHSKDMCFSNRDFVTFEKGKWQRYPALGDDSVMLCTG